MNGEVAAIMALKLAALEPSLFEIRDDSSKHQHHGDFGLDAESHFNLKIVSEHFVGKSMVQRHKMIYKLLEQELKGPVHALALATLTKEEML
jgi:stress-induced morphogen